MVKLTLSEGKRLVDIYDDEDKWINAFDRKDVFKLIDDLKDLHERMVD